MKIVKKLGLASVLSTLYLGFAKAQNWEGGTTLQQQFKIIFDWAVAIAGIVFVVMFLVGGIQYLTSAGNEETSGKAKKLLLDAVIGIIIVSVAYAAGTYVLGKLQLGTPTF